MLQPLPERMCLFSVVGEDRCDCLTQAWPEGLGLGLGQGPGRAPMSLVAACFAVVWPSVGIAAMISRNDRVSADMEAWKAQQGDLYNNAKWHCIHIRVS